MSEFTTTSSRLHVLHVEDNPADAELIRALLEEEWPDCVIDRVQTREAFLNSLSAAKFNLILSDFSLPQFDGLSALALARQRDMSTPFIFISGTIGEDNAVDALRRGATDYVIKDRPRRLIPAIHRALQEVAVHEQRRHAETQLREQAELLDKARDAIVVSSANRRITYWNQAAARIFGWQASEALGKTSADLFGASAVLEIEAVRKALESGDEWRGEVRLHNKAGQPVVMDSRVTIIRDGSGRPRSHLIISTDITEQKKLEQQFLQAQRIESIGILAGGIAHDLNNALAPILMGLSMLQQKSQDAEVKRLMGVMEKSAQHGASLVRQVLAFARGTQGERAELQPAAIIREAVTLLGETLPRAISVEMTSEPDLALMSADSTQLSQVMMNLGINARDAMPDGGRLLFRALNVQVGESQARAHPGIEPGLFVLIAVEDTGTGIPPDIIERIFDPFFTTKGAGKGSGLGLSTVLGIVKSHGGFMEVDSELGRGTQFNLYFPAVTATALSRPAETPVAPPRGEGETILVIDDEADVREVVQALLETSGYKVVLAADGMSGLALYGKERAKIAAVITDMMMPAMQGPQVLKELQRLNPDVKVVAMSGVLGNNSNIREVPGRVLLLQKPMTGVTLLQTVHRLLHTKA